MACTYIWLKTGVFIGEKRDVFQGLFGWRTNPFLCFRFLSAKKQQEARTIIKISYIQNSCRDQNKLPFSKNC